MDLIPVPELVVGLVIGLVVLGVRTLWRFRRVPATRERIRRLPGDDRNIQQKRAQLIASCVLLVIISVPLILRVVPPNGMYGFRTASTRSNPAIWYPANAFMGWALAGAALVSATLLVMLPPAAKRWLVWATFLVPVFGAIIASFVYLSALT
jgi:hypothetical protein